MHATLGEPLQITVVESKMSRAYLLCSFGPQRHKLSKRDGRGDGTGILRYSTCSGLSGFQSY